MRTKIGSFFPPRLRSARTIFNYYKRHVDIFFTKPILLKDSSGHVRSYICDAMRRLSEWYDQKSLSIYLSVQNNLQKSFKLRSHIHFKHYYLGHKLAAKSCRNYQNLLVPYSVIETKFFLGHGTICQDDFLSIIKIWSTRTQATQARMYEIR